MTRLDKLSPKPDRAGRFWAQFSDGTRLGLYRQTVEEWGLFPGMELSEEQLARLEQQAGAMSAKMRAVRIVTASNVSRRDLEQRLVRKGENPEQAREAVDWMEQLNLVDDAETAKLIAQRCAARGYGPARLKQMLYEKQIPREYWEDVLADYPCQDEEMEKFIRSKLPQHPDSTQIRRVTEALLRRGHSWADVRRVMNTVLEDETLPEDM